MRRCLIRTLCLLALAWSTAGFAATGDILSCTIDTLGWKATVVIEGFKDGGAYAWGFTTSTNKINIPSAAKVVFTVVSEGYNAAGALGTITRTVYGTKTLRKPYPDNATLQETEGGGNLSIVIALSDPIYDDDNTGGGKSGTAPTVSIASGWYTDSGSGGSSAPNAVCTNLAVTNSSALDYPKVHGNWAWPCYDRVTANFDVEFGAFSNYGQGGKPVACVIFTATDESAHSVPQTVTSMIVSTKTSAVSEKVQVYKGTVDISGLDDQEVITVNAVAYPQVGDADSILNTGDAVNTMPTPLYAPQYYFNDKGGTYGVTVAVVDPGGDNGTGVATDIASKASADAAPCLTIAGAIAKITGYNNTNHGRADVTAAIIYLNAGSYAWTGAANTPGTITKCYLTVTHNTGVAIADAKITSTSGDKDAGERVKLDGVNIDVAAAAGIFSKTTSVPIVLWLKDCLYDDNNDSSLVFYHNQFVSMTGCTITNIVLLKAYASAVCTFPLIRGCNIDSATGTVDAYTFLGNNFYYTGAGSPVVGDSHGVAVPVPDNQVIAYNFISTLKRAISALAARDTVHGPAVVGNVLERRATGTSYPLIWIAADGSDTTNDNVGNVLLWHNTLMGERVNAAYNDTSTYVCLRPNWSVKNNLFDAFNTKNDLFPTEDAARIGNWDHTYGVSYRGNFFGGMAVYNNNFEGLDGKTIITGNFGGIEFNFVDDQSQSGGGAGNGNYRLTASSLAIDYAVDWLLPFDLDGNARKSGGAIGAYGYNESAIAIRSAQELNLEQ